MRRLSTVIVDVAVDVDVDVDVDEQPVSLIVASDCYVFITSRRRLPAVIVVVVVFGCGASSVVPSRRSAASVREA
jgi:hypothetical protein